MSVRSGYSAHSGSSIGGYDQNVTQRQPAYPQQQDVYDDNAVRSGIERTQYDGPQYPTGPSQQYYRLEGHGGYSGVIAPEMLEADDNLRNSPPHISSQYSSPQSPPQALSTFVGSSSSSTPAVAHTHLPKPSVYALSPPSPDDPEHYLRHTLGLPRDRPVDLWALVDPPGRGKPNQPYPTLMKLAIFGSPQKKLTLQEIYKALIDRFEWFTDNANEAAWKVRCNCRHYLYK